jgi:hypothetical protein
LALPKKIGTFRRVAEVISLFIGMGCKLHTTSTKIQLNDGEFFQVKYLLSPDGTNFVPIEDLNDDEFISEDEIEYWERRLGVSIPRPNEIH